MERPRSAPCLLIHGDKDSLVPIQQSEVFVAKLKECGVPHKLEVRKGVGHGPSRRSRRGDR